MVKPDMNPLKHILSPKMIFLERNHLELKIISKKALLSVTLGEPIIKALTRLLVGAFIFYCKFINAAFLTKTALINVIHNYIQ